MKKMKNSWILAAAVAALPLVGLGGAAEAQHQVGGDGRALDASNQIGSGGVNRSVPGATGATGNEIITGNVTGGREFRGVVPYTDPRAFRGATVGNTSDRFIRDSAGVPNQMAPQTDLTRPQPYYGEARSVAPPPGFVRQGFTGGYTPAMPTAPRRTAGDMRLSPPVEGPEISLPQPGQLMMPGPLDPEQQPTVLTASPLYGVRQWRVGDEADSYFLGRHTALRRDTAMDRLRLDERQIQRLRQELEATIVREQDGEAAPADGQLREPRLMRPFEAPDDPSVTRGELSSQLPGQVLRHDTRTDQGTRQRLMVPPQQQSAQYAELRRRLERYDTRRETDQEAYREFREQVRQRDLELAHRPGLDPADPTILRGEPGGMDRFGPPGGIGPGQDPSQLREQPGVAAVPPTGFRHAPGLGLPTDQGIEPAERPQGIERFGIPDYARMSQQMWEEQLLPGRGVDPQERDLMDMVPRVLPPEPLRVESLATGVQARGLAEILSRAEENMREGRYTAALDQYDAAEQVAPNNPLILLGRANAELGAGYYARAENHLRQAFMVDRSLLMGQYDLRQFLGEERLATLEQDLQQIAQNDPDQPRPVFLLAYMAYNTGQERRAAGYLDLAERRAEGQDPLYPLIREHWLLERPEPEVQPDEQEAQPVEPEAEDQPEPLEEMEADPAD
jgi:tetratricopeptide (TPR) repeat protein